MSGESAGKDWHSSKSIGKRARYLLNYPDEEIPSDVSFLVGDGKNEALEIFKCHKFILAMVSSMFQAMFYGTFPHTDDITTIPDVTPMAFRRMLWYAYGDDDVLHDNMVCLEDALDILYCAKKYLIDKLEHSCRDYLQLHVASTQSKTDVCIVIQRAPQMDEEDLATLALASMSCDFYATEVMKGEGFLRLSFDCLKTIVDCPHLNAKEADIYQGVRRWVEHNVGVVEGSALRDACGSLLRSIRFPLFSAAELADGPITDGVLTGDEISSIFQFFFAKAKPTVPFLTVPRIPLPGPVFCCFQLVTVPVTGLVDVLCYENMLTIHARPDLAPECCAFLQQLITGKFHIRIVSTCASYDNEYVNNTLPFPAAIPEERNFLSHSVKNACWFEWDVEGQTVCNVRIGVSRKSRGCRSAVFGFVWRLSLDGKRCIPFYSWEDRRIQGVANFVLFDSQSDNNV